MSPRSAFISETGMVTTKIHNSSYSKPNRRCTRSTSENAVPLRICFTTTRSENRVNFQRCRGFVRNELEGGCWNCRSPARRSSGLAIVWVVFLPHLPVTMVGPQDALMTAGDRLREAPRVRNFDFLPRFWVLLPPKIAETVVQPAPDWTGHGGREFESGGPVL
jgi:hypothetical protein